MPHNNAFQMTTANIRFGAGCTREVGMDLADMGVKRAMVVTDPTLSKLPPVARVLQSLEDAGVAFSLFDQVLVEPTDASFGEAIVAAQAEPFDAFVPVGGGSSIDTAKAANLYSTYPADFLDYVNAPIGKANPVPGPLKPLIAIPTTAGTGSETTTVAVFGLKKLKTKTGIARPQLKPTLGIVDPDNTRTMPPAVAASTGLDVLSHAAEAYTAVPFGRRRKPPTPMLRWGFQGSNPISDVWSLQALRMVADSLPRAVADPTDDEARANMLLASAYAGIGFGNAGVHLPHAMSYPVAARVRSFKPDGYVVDHPMVPHGAAVILHAPAVFRFTASASPERHLQVAEALGADVTRANPDDAGKILADRIIEFMQRLNLPNGLGAVGYEREDIPALVEGTLPQKRITKLSPREVDAEALTQMFEDALVYW